MSTGTSTPTLASGQGVLNGDHRIYIGLTANLYAMGSGSVTVMPNIGYVGSGGSGGGGTGGSVTQGSSPWVDNVSQFGGAAVATGTGASGAGIPRVTVSNDSTIGLVGTLPAYTTTPTFNFGTLNGAATAANQNVTTAGTSATSAQAIQGVTGGVPQNVTNTGLFPVQNTAATPAGTNAIGTVGVTSLPDAVAPPGFPASPTVTGVAGSAVDTTGYAGVSLQVTGTFVATITVQDSNDNANWSSETVVSDGSTGAFADGTSVTSAGTFFIPARARYVRFNVTSYTSGTPTITPYLRANQGSVRSVYAYSFGQQANGSAASGNPLRVAGSDGGSVARDLALTTSGAMQPPTAASGKITKTATALAANTSTTIAAANTSRIALQIQCGTGAVSVDETGAALTAAGVGNGTEFIPNVASSTYTPVVATRTAITAYTATAQTCVVTEYNQ